MTFSKFLKSSHGLFGKFTSIPNVKFNDTKQSSRDKSFQEDYSGQSSHSAMHSNSCTYGLAEIIRGCVQSAMTPQKLRSPGSSLPVNKDDDEHEAGSSETTQISSHLDIAASLVWVEGGIGVYRNQVMDLVSTEVEQQLGFVGAFRAEEESFERRLKARDVQREKSNHSHTSTHDSFSTTCSSPIQKGRRKMSIAER